MKSLQLTLLFIALTWTTVFAQETQRLQTITTTSEVMNEERTIKVYLPQDYSEEEVYPVIYITDASTQNFDAAKNYLDVLTIPVYNAIPKSILVGISHTNRNAELDVFQRESGQMFKKHLIDEVVPAIDSTYNTSGFNVMVGHSNGAEFNHFLFLEEENPFRGFISISTAFNTDVKDEVANAFRTYDGKPTYYFVANGTRDAQMRIDAGIEMQTISESADNSNIYFQLKEYSADHQSIVAHSLLDGLTFMFKDYQNIKKYSNVIEYGENYLKDLKRNYGITGKYDLAHTDPYFMDIMMNKNVDEYHYTVKLINDHKLFFGKGIDPINIANHYYIMEKYDKTIEHYNDALENYNSYEEQFGEHFEKMYRRMLKRPISSYENLGKIDELIDFLEKSTAVLPEKNTFFVNYKIAQLSQEHQISLDKGKQAVEYCKSNFVENKNISMDDVIALNEKLGSTTPGNSK